MKRNLESRVEVMVPVEDPHLRHELRTILDVQLGATDGAWDMKSDGTYVKRLAKTPGPDAQHLLIERSDKRLRESTRLRRRRPKGIARRLAR
jgi:polyphosphate kinase